MHVATMVDNTKINVTIKTRLDEVEKLSLVLIILIIEFCIILLGSSRTARNGKTDASDSNSAAPLANIMTKASANCMRLFLFK